MRRGSRVAIVSAGLLAAACAYQPRAVPVAGAPASVAALEGEWVGEYWSLDTGRSGSILFRLEAGRDTAMGDVLMLPSELPHAHTGEHPRSEYVPINFVYVEGTRVRGLLDPYRDPECGCRLETQFEGTLEGDRITGTFTSRHIEGGRVQRGEWRVTRRPTSG